MVNFITFIVLSILMTLVMFCTKDGHNNEHVVFGLMWVAIGLTIIIMYILVTIFPWLK